MPQLLNRRHVQRAFQMRGLSVRSDACDAVINVLRRQEETTEALQQLIRSVKEHLLRNSASTTIVTKEILTIVVSELSKDSQDILHESIQLLSAFETPRLMYDTMRKEYLLLRKEDEERSLHAKAAEYKIDMFVQRYSLIHQRLLRQDIFRPKLVSGKHNGATYNDSVMLTPVEALLGGSSAGATKTILGMIVQIEENKYYLEDLTGQTLLNLSQSEVLSAGYITEMCIVLVEGEWIDGVFHATKIGHPPSEPRLSSLKYLGYSKSDIFDAIPSDLEYQKLLAEEERYEGTRFVVVSDVYLDSPQVMTKLEKLFQGFTATMTPISQQLSLPIFVLMGNFTSKPITYQEGIAYLVSLFEDFADWANRKFPALTQEARFIFIPGPNDLLPMGGLVLPRGPLPRLVTNSIQSKFHHVAFSSNPCRLRYFTKEIVLVRHRNQLLDTHSLLRPLDEYDRTHHTIKTLLDQGHLSPLPLTSQPIYWQFDHALRLFPLPDAIVLADSNLDSYCQSYLGCTAMNPGSISNSEFLVYDPVRDSVELCQISE